MDRSERTNDQLVAINTALRGKQAEMWTALPGVLQSFDAEKMTCTVQPAIQGQQLSKEGTWSNATLPLLVDCPVVFPGGGGFTLTFPLAEGDEGLVVFSSRCIDAWWQSGGVQPQADLRMHDLSDGFFIPGVRSQARPLAGVLTDGVQLRADDGASFIEIKDGACRLVFPGGVLVEGPLTVTQTLNVQNSEGAPQTSVIVGSIEATGDISAQGTMSGAVVQQGAITLGGHKHGGVTTGSGQTGGPTP